MPAKKKKASKKSKKSKDPKPEEEKKPEDEEPEYIDPAKAFPEVEVQVSLVSPPLGLSGKLSRPHSYRLQGYSQNKHSHLNNKTDDHRQIRRFNKGRGHINVQRFIFKQERELA